MLTSKNKIQEKDAQLSTTQITGPCVLMRKLTQHNYGQINSVGRGEALMLVLRSSISTCEIN